ncbi:MAG: phosphatidate cytidylyltransferase [Clostridia bacterium]|nr:phosphatidate cytidylyltransferase [Clostridia bacterium]
MKTRIISALICVPLVVAALLQPFDWIWGIIILAVSLIGLYEFYKATDLIKCKPLCVMGFLSAFYFALGYFIVLPSEILFILWLGILFALMLIFNRKINAGMIGLTILSAIYIPFLLSYVIGLRQMIGGEFYIWLIVICAFLTDTCAYFTGIAIGKHKLCPNLSPKKTIEGAIGGVVGCGLFCMLFGLIISRFFNQDVNFLSLFILGLIASASAQLGDLTASAIKRQYGIKDYGNLIPGHGGILDRLDSIIFVAPVIYTYIVNIGI